MKKVRRDYRDANGNKLPSVTTVIGLLNKPALMGWAARIAAEATAHAIIEGGMAKDAAVALGKIAHNRTRDHAADLGTRAHDLVERHYVDGPPMVDVSDSDNAKVHGAYARVVAHFDGTETTVVASEVQLVDLTLGFGGTLDFVLSRGGLMFMGDLKTGKAAYDEVVIQLAAYRWLWNLHNPTQQINGGGLVIHSPIEGECTEIPITIAQLDAGRHIFGCLLEVYKALPKCKLNRLDIGEGGVP